MLPERFFQQIEQKAESALKHLGYELVFANKTVAGVEVDRIFQDGEGDWIVCEIKAISDWKYLDVRVRPFQKKRLELARKWLFAYAAPGDVYIQYAYVHYKLGEVRVYNESGDEMAVIPLEIVGSQH